MDPDEARRRFAAARVARLATAGADGRPHLVPITFALAAAAGVVFAVDHKPKTTTALRRLANIAQNPQVSLLADEYDEDWTRLWWARADGIARILPAGHPALAPLVAKYPQYARNEPTGPVVVVATTRWSGWSYS